MMGEGSRSNALDDHKKILAAAKARALNRVRAGRDAGATSPLDEAAPPTPPADAMTQEPPATAAAGPPSGARIQVGMNGGGKGFTTVANQDGWRPAGTGGDG
jgi:hypothetical protein